MGDKRTYNEKLQDKHGGASTVAKHVNQGRQRDAKHQGAAKK